MIAISTYTDANLLEIDLSSTKEGNFHYVLDILRWKISGASYNPEIKKWLIPTATIELLPPFYDLPHGREFVVLTVRAARAYQREFQRTANLIEIKEAHEYDLGLNGRMKLPLRPYQTVGAKFLYEAQRAINGDTVGLGKSCQGLAASQMMFERKEADAFLLIIPASLTEKWIAEIEKFTYSQIIVLNRSSLLKRNAVTRYKRLYRAGYYLVMSYGMTFRYLDRIVNNLKNVPGFRLGLICDEIQYIKNYASNRSKATKKIAAASKTLFGLSATYLETSVTDVHSIMEAVNPAALNLSAYKFRDRYAQTDYWGSVRGYNHGKELKQKLASFVIRRYKEDVAEELPKREMINYWINLKPAHRDFYQDVLEQVTEKINDMRREGQVQMATALALMIYLRQACLNTEIMGHDKPVDSKFEILMEILQGTERDTKVVIFCFFKTMVEILARELNSKGVKAVGIHAGNCPKKDRLEAIKRFGNSNTKVLVTSDILREGHDILCASHIVQYDLLWNPAAMEQRCGRIDRIGQTADTVFIHRIISRGTVEEYMFQRMSTYKSMGDDIMDDSRAFQRITLRDIDKALKLQPK